MKHRELTAVRKLTDFFVSQYGHPFNGSIPADVIRRLNQLNRAGRGELKDSLFNQARILEQTSEGGSVIFWLQNCFITIEKYSFRLHKVYFSPGFDIIDNLCSLIEQGRKTVDLCVFTITDSRLSEKITQRFRQGVRFRIITDDQKIYDHGSEIIELERIGIPVKTDRSRYHMHNKFGIIDQRIVFTGSFNWTYTASKHNQENLLVTTNFDIVNQYEEEFERLWGKMYDL
ncbi:MAG: phospholipase D-like domain-containing protein [Prolixibacteraceae bacterium]|jgi:phosphatidylserine/phosphatidylglycerophosphate/cardiolipin synthase-like enzyme|nr:phospholipase D-like domain-containing protein [Prolixibacteraceae bacterium]